MLNSMDYNSSKKDDIKLSRKLCKLLRHNPRNLKMLSTGYVKVIDILQLSDFKKYKISDIIRIVDNNDKQRFSLRNTGDKILIRANQGHGIDIINRGQLLTKINDSSTIPICVHGTYFKAWKNIKTSGLSRMNRNNIHMAVGIPGDDGVISGMRSSCEIIIYIDLKKAMREGGLIFYISSNNVILTKGPILPCYFSKCIRRKDGVDLLDLRINNVKDI